MLTQKNFLESYAITRYFYRIKILQAYEKKIIRVLCNNMIFSL